MDLSPAILLKQARQAAGLNQRELARRAKTAQSVVARIELGITSPSWATLSRLLRAAGSGIEPALTNTSAARAAAAVSVARELALPSVAVAPSHAAATKVDAVLGEIGRTLALSAEDRLRELRNVDRFLSAVKRA